MLTCYDELWNKEEKQIEQDHENDAQTPTEEQIHQWTTVAVNKTIDQWKKEINTLTKGATNIIVLGQMNSLGAKVSLYTFNYNPEE